MNHILKHFSFIIFEQYIEICVFFVKRNLIFDASNFFFNLKLLMRQFDKSKIKLIY